MEQPVTNLLYTHTYNTITLWQSHIGPSLWHSEAKSPSAIPNRRFAITIYTPQSRNAEPMQPPQLYNHMIGVLNGTIAFVSVISKVN